MPTHKLWSQEINFFFLKFLFRIEENDRMERERREQAKQQQKLQMQRISQMQSDSDAPQLPLFGVPKKVSKMLVLSWTIFRSSSFSENTFHTIIIAIVLKSS